MCHCALQDCLLLLLVTRIARTCPICDSTSITDHEGYRTPRGRQSSGDIWVYDRLSWPSPGESSTQDSESGSRCRQPHWMHSRLHTHSCPVLQYPPPLLGPVHAMKVDVCVCVRKVDRAAGEKGRGQGVGWGGGGLCDGTRNKTWHNRK